MSASLTWNDNAEQIHQKAMAALLRGGEKILSKANSEETPWSSGALGGSGNVEQDSDDAVVVSFNTPYAYYQHDNVLNHPNPRDPKSLAGRKDHYLRDPAIALWPDICDDISAALSE